MLPSGLLDYNDLILKYPRELVVKTYNELIARALFMTNEVEQFEPFLLNYGQLPQARGRAKTQNLATRARAPIVYATHLYAYTDIFSLLKTKFNMSIFDYDWDMIYSTSLNKDEFTLLTDAQIDYFKSPPNFRKIMDVKWMCDLHNLLLHMRYMKSLTPLVLCQTSYGNYERAYKNAEGGEDYLKLAYTNYPFFIISNIPQTVHVNVHPDDVGILAEWDTIFPADGDLEIRTEYTENDAGYLTMMEAYANLFGIYWRIPEGMPKLYRSERLTMREAHIPFPRINVQNIIYDAEWGIKNKGGTILEQN